MLVIAEKPSVAKSLATVLGVKNNKDGYMEGGGYFVSWCYGHLVELAPPTAYGDQYKRWNRASLPILPETWKHTASREKKKQLDILLSLMNHSDVDTVVNACDAGREGELIFRLVYEHCGCKKPVQRLWISSMEDSVISTGFENLRDGSSYDNLYHAALGRARADWLVGMNATRLFSCLYGATLNVGRVQSPTLAMLVEREAAVQAFIPEPFYTPVIDTGSFCAWGERKKTPEEADAVRAACDGMNALVLSVEKKEKTEASPKLYDLTTLQRDTNRLLGYTAQQTLDLAQSLYEKKLITYPRTDSQYITSDMADRIDTLVNLVAMRMPFIKVSLPINAVAVINDARVSDHHAILPTEAVRSLDFETLPSGERNILSMLIARLVCAVSEPHRYESVTATLECAGCSFTAKGKTVLQDGWEAIDAAFRASLKDKAENEDDSDDVGSLPDLTDGQVFSSVKAFVKEGTTSPPKRFTEDTLLSAMESADVEDKVHCPAGAREGGLGHMPDDAERTGLGTPATRAGVIEKLVKSGSVVRKKKKLIPTEKGINLITILPEDIKSAALTAEWEHKLKQVECGELSDTVFMDGISALVSRLVAAHVTPDPAFASLFAPTPKGAVVGKCPRCGTDVVEGFPRSQRLRGKRRSDEMNEPSRSRGGEESVVRDDEAEGFFCSSHTYRFALWKDSRFWEAKGKKLDKKTATALLSGERVFFSNLRSQKTGKSYAATVLMEDNGAKVNYKLIFDDKERKSA